jgi:hypothetical protein
VDIPGLGLNFVSGSLPAFFNGGDVTFDVRYRAAGDDAWHTLITDVPASAPFTFTLPQPGYLHYTDIRFDFGTVPANFALGNEIVLTFVVGDNAPNNQLVNRFVVFHGNYPTEGDSPLIPIVRPPVPTVPPGSNRVLISNGGGYYEVNPDGEPLGEWAWSETETSWIFDPMPVGAMPQTGVNHSRTLLRVFMYGTIAIVGLAVLWFVIHTKFKKRASEDVA